MLLLAAAWRDLLSARDRLVSARSTIDQVVSHPTALDTSDGRAATQQQLTYAIDDVTIAHEIIHDSLPLKLFQVVPVASTQRAGMLRLVDDSNTVLTTGNRLITEANQLVVAGHINGAQVPMASLATFESELKAAGATVNGVDRPSRGLLGPLATARREFDTLAQSTSSRLFNDAAALDVGQKLLGKNGSRHYLVALENNAEMRDQGTILSYALLTVDNGHLQITQHGPIVTPLQVPGLGTTQSLLLKSPAPIAVPAGTAQVFGFIDPTQTWQSVNATADFDFSAKAMQAMYHQATGQSIDGVIALDVPALTSILEAVGPVSVPDINVQVTAQDAPVVLLHDLYNDFSDNQQIVRKVLQEEVVTEVVAKLSSGSFDPLPLAQGLASSAAGGHLRVWSDVPSEEATLETVGLGGGPATTLADRTFHLAVENRSATKMDYYVTTAAEQQVTIASDGSAVVRTTVIVHNSAPPGAAPSYQLGPDGITTTKPGEYWAWVLLWGPAGSAQTLSVPESGLELTQTVIPRIYAGQTQQVVLVTVIPHAVQDGKLVLRYVPQPRLTPAGLSVTVSAPGWKISGTPSWAGPWNKTLVLSWSVRK